MVNAPPAAPDADPIAPPIVTVARSVSERPAVVPVSVFVPDAGVMPPHRIGADVIVPNSVPLP